MLRHVIVKWVENHIGTSIMLYMLVCTLLYISAMALVNDERRVLLLFSFVALVLHWHIQFLKRKHKDKRLAWEWRNNPPDLILYYLYGVIPPVIGILAVFGHLLFDFGVDLDFLGNLTFLLMLVSIPILVGCIVNLKKKLITESRINLSSA